MPKKLNGRLLQKAIGNDEDDSVTAMATWENLQKVLQGASPPELRLTPFMVSYLQARVHSRTNVEACERIGRSVQTYQMYLYSRPLFYAFAQMVRKNQGLAQTKMAEAVIEDHIVKSAKNIGEVVGQKLDWEHPSVLKLQTETSMKLLESHGVIKKPQEDEVTSYVRLDIFMQEVQDGKREINIDSEDGEFKVIATTPKQLQQEQSELAQESADQSLVDS